MKGVVLFENSIKPGKDQHSLEFANYKLPTVGVPSSAHGIRGLLCIQAHHRIRDCLGQTGFFFFEI